MTVATPGKPRSGHLATPISISVVLCTYNRAGRLRDTLNRLDQVRIPTRCDFELIVVNNNSTDDTARCCEEFTLRTRLSFRWCTETRQGLSHARNRGLAEARGSVIIFTDDDISVPENWVEEYERTFRAHEADCVFGRIVPDWDGDVPRWYDTKFSAIYGALDYGPHLFVVRTKNFEFFGANFACRKALLTELGGFDPQLGRTPDRLYISEERKIFVDLFEQGCTIVYNPNIDVQHHVTPEMKTQAYVRRYYRDTATSLVNITPFNPKRQVFGIPYFRLYESATFLLLFLPRVVESVGTGHFRRLFPLRLELARTTRMLRLYVLRHLQHRP